MFGDLLGNMEEKQKALKAELQKIVIEEQVADGKIKIRVNANRKVEGVFIDPEYLKEVDREELEDFLIIGMNAALETAGAKEAEATQGLLSDMLPGGLSNLGGMFGS